MTRPVNQPSMTQPPIYPPLPLMIWIVFLTAILIPVAVIANFNLGFNQFKIEMAEHWVDYKPSTQSSTNPNAGLSAIALEQMYNKIAHAMNHVSVRISGGRMISGAADQVHGSGVVLADQYVLTNFHVVGGATDIQVTVYTPANTELTLPATLMLTDQANDLALLKINTNVSLPSASIGNSDTVQPGDMVFAIGNAFGSGNIFTSGMVSDTNQNFSVDGRQYLNMIQTETYTYPGSSGGPLANINGEIVGINTAIYSPQGNFTGISLAIPINRVLPLLQKSGITALDGPAGQVAGGAYFDSNFYSLVA